MRATDWVPGVRGVVRLAEAFVVIPLVKRALPAARLPFQDPGVVAALPAPRSAARCCAAACAAPAARPPRRSSLLPALFALRGGELAAYHGVEHKAIAAYEADAEDAADAAKEHDRCGSHLVAPMLAANLAGTLLLRRAVERPGPLAAGAVALASPPRRWRSSPGPSATPRRRAARALRRPGFEIQRLVGTREPDERQLEVGRAALAEILRAEDGDRTLLNRAETPVSLAPGARHTRRMPSMEADRVPQWYQIESWIITWAPIIFMGLLVFFIWRTLKLMPRTKPQQIEPESASSIGWEEVAGADEAKAELAEVVEFLRDPARFQALGAHVPKGILLHGPPGTGKTLLAKAVADESGAQFFSQSAASFVEMFAGLGAARIRRLFAEARKHAPGDHLHRRARRRRRRARHRQQLRARADAQPAARRDGRLQLDAATSS